MFQSKSQLVTFIVDLLMDKIFHGIEGIQSYPINKEKNNGLIVCRPLVWAFSWDIRKDSNL